MHGGGKKIEVAGWPGRLPQGQSLCRKAACPCRAVTKCNFRVSCAWSSNTGYDRGGTIRLLAARSAIWATTVRMGDQRCVPAYRASPVFVNQTGYILIRLIDRLDDDLQTGKPVCPVPAAGCFDAGATTSGFNCLWFVDAPAENPGFPCKNPLPCLSGHLVAAGPGSSRQWTPRPPGLIRSVGTDRADAGLTLGRRFAANDLTSVYGNLLRAPIPVSRLSS